MTTAHLLLCPIALDKIFSYTISYWICTFANKCINRYSSLNSRLVPSIHLITFLVLEVCSAITLELLKGTIKPLTTLEWGQKDAQTYTSIAKNKPFKRNKQELLQHCGFPSNLHLCKWSRCRHHPGFTMQEKEFSYHKQWCQDKRKSKNPELTYCNWGTPSIQ